MTLLFTDETWSKSLNMLILPFSSNEENNISLQIEGVSQYTFMST